GNQHVKGRLDKPVIVIPRRTDVVGSSEIIRVFITGPQAEVQAVEQSLLKTAYNIGVREILIGKEPGIVNPPAGRQVNSRPFEWMMCEAHFKDRCGVRTPIAIKLTKLGTRRSIHTQFGRRLIIEARVHLLETLVRRWVVHPIVPEGAANTD